MQAVQNDLMQILGLKNPTDAQRRAAYSFALETVQNRVYARIVDSFEEEEFLVLDEAFKNRDDDNLRVLFETHGLPTYKDLVNQEWQLYIRELSELVAQ